MAKNNLKWHIAKMRKHKHRKALKKNRKKNKK